MEGKPGTRVQIFFYLLGLGLERLGDDAGVLTQSVRPFVASRGWERDRESRTRVASVVASASRERGSQTGVAKWSRECESRNGVAKVSREMGSRL